MHGMDIKQEKSSSIKHQCFIYEPPFDKGVDPVVDCDLDRCVGEICLWTMHTRLLCIAAYYIYLYNLLALLLVPLQRMRCLWKQLSMMTKRSRLVGPRGLRNGKGGRPIDFHWHQTQMVQMRHEQSLAILQSNRDVRLACFSSLLACSALSQVWLLLLDVDGGDWTGHNIEGA